ALSSNLGDRDELIAGAMEQLGALAGMTALVATEAEATAPLGGLDQPVYLNAMVRGEWLGTPEDLLAHCHRIESAAGRDRTRRWSSRTLDLDLVRF
ncbi:MAG TPA: 2-amino-4-hydroxy-6-hydroxymethyldihydropteridine diphosphokinase, partial [Gemmatimonadales bacterium]|nr:2-amino-4-hydroxy-6-hydroxymethyldihydropteridine diphosphokinase [Gemmatimonadales bacterium]